jgi:hypothetical protein
VVFNIFNQGAGGINVNIQQAMESYERIVQRAAQNRNQ